MKILDKITEKFTEKLWLSLDGKYPEDEPQFTLTDIDGNDVVDIDSNQIGTL